MPNEIPYKSFCWALGTTSFRTKDFNKTIEEQLALLDGFWALPENHGAGHQSSLFREQTRQAAPDSASETHLPSREKEANP